MKLWTHRTMALLLGVVVFVVYCMTLQRTVPGGDSGELVSVAHHLGVAHPPGYPLWTILGHVATWLPFGHVAARVALLSALAQSAAAVFLFLAVVQFTRNSLSALVASGMYAFAPVAWRYAVVAEVFSLNAMFFAWLLYLAVLQLTAATARRAILASAVLGLGLCNHHTLIFFGTPCVLWMIWRVKPLPIWQSMLAGALGLLPYLYLPWATHRDVLVSWGNTATWSGFWRHFFRSEYGTFRLAVNGQENVFWDNLAAYFIDLPKELLVVGFVVAGYGAWSLSRVPRKKQVHFGTLLLTIYVAYLVIFHSLANLELSDALLLQVQQRFWMMPLVLVCFWLGIGCNALLPYFRKHLRYAPLVSGIVVLGQLALNWSNEDQSKNTFLQDLAATHLTALPQNAVLFVTGDASTNIFRYVQGSEFVRPDVHIIAMSLLKDDWYDASVRRHFADIKWPPMIEFSIKDFLDLNLGQLPIFYPYIPPEDRHRDRSLDECCDLAPLGWTNQIARHQAPIDIADYIRKTDALRALFNAQLYAEPPMGSWEHGLWRDTWENDHRRALFLAKYALAQSPVDITVLRNAATLLENLIVNYSYRQPEHYKNVGVMYQHLVPFDPSANEKMRRYWSSYVKDADPSDPEVIAIKNLLAH